MLNMSIGKYMVMLMNIKIGLVTTNLYFHI